MLAVLQGVSTFPATSQSLGEGSPETPALGVQPTGNPQVTARKPIMGQWNDHGFMDGGMAAKMGVHPGKLGIQQGNGHAGSESVLSTDDDPQLEKLAEGMMMAADSSEGSAEPKEAHSIWQPTGQGSTSKPPGGATAISVYT